MYLTPLVLAPATAGRCPTKRSTMDSFVISFSGKKKHSKLGERFQPQSLAYLKIEGGLWSINCSFVHWCTVLQCWHWHVELTEPMQVLQDGLLQCIQHWPITSCLLPRCCSWWFFWIFQKDLCEGYHRSPCRERVLSSLDTQLLDVQYLHTYLSWWRH